MEPRSEESTSSEESSPPQLYLDKVQEDLLALVNDLEFGKLLDYLSQAELDYSPNVEKSRLNGTQERIPDWRLRTLFLLFNVHRDVLRAILDNTLPSKAKTTLKGRVRDVSDLTGNDIDPFVYIQWLAPKLGNGMTIAEFKLYLKGLLIVVNLAEDDEDQFLAADRNRHISDGDHLRAHLQRVFREIAHTRASTTGPAGYLFNREEPVPEAFENTVREFVDANVNRALPQAEARGDNCILPRAEAGWAIRGVQRVAQHRRLNNTPQIFRVSQCLLHYLFPEKNFMLHQFAVFEITAWQDAHVAEAVASHLGASYVDYGGYNVSQGGVNVDSFGADVDWTELTMEAVKNKVFRYQKRNWREWDEKLRDRIDDNETLVRQLQNAKEQHRLEQKEKTDRKMLETKLTELALVTKRVAKTTAEVEEKYKEFEGKVRQLKDGVQLLEGLAARKAATIL